MLMQTGFVYTCYHVVMHVLRKEVFSIYFYEINRMNSIHSVFVQVMQHWLEYTRYRKQRHQHYNNAVNYYRKSLLHIGVTEWIRVRVFQYNS